MLRMSIQPASRLFAGVVLTPGFPCCIHSSGESGDTEMKEPAGPRQSPLRQQFKFTSPDTVFGDISNGLPVFLHEMSYIWGHLQRFTRVFARDVPHSGTSPTFYPRFRPKCPTFGDISNVLPVFSSEMSHIRGHLQRFAGVFARDVPHPGTPPTPFPFPPGPGQQAGARRAFNRAPRSARPVAAGQRTLRRRCPVNIYSIFLLNALHPLLPVRNMTLPGSPPAVHPVSARDVPLPGTSPTFYPRFRPKCPTFGDTSNVLPPFSSEMSHIQGHFQRFNPVFARDVPYPGTPPTLHPRFRTTCPTFGDISNVLTRFSHEMSHIQGHLQRFAGVFARDVPHPGTSPTFCLCFCTILGHLMNFDLSLKNHSDFWRNMI